MKVATGSAPYLNIDGASNYVAVGELPPPHLCAACGEEHALGWCKLKVAGVEHCGLCGIAHLGRGRTCPHLNSEIQVATLLGTLKESTESRELIDKATKYLRMIRGDLVHRKSGLEKKSQKQTNAETTGHQPSKELSGLGGDADPASRQGEVVNVAQDAEKAWRNAYSWSRQHGLHPPVRPDGNHKR